MRPEGEALVPVDDAGRALVLGDRDLAADRLVGAAARGHPMRDEVQLVPLLAEVAARVCVVLAGDGRFDERTVLETTTLEGEAHVVRVGCRSSNLWLEDL